MALERDSREDGDDQKLLEAPRFEHAPARGRGEPSAPAADKADPLRVPPRREQPAQAAPIANLL